MRSKEFKLSRFILMLILRFSLFGHFLMLILSLQAQKQEVPASCSMCAELRIQLQQSKVLNQLQLQIDSGQVETMECQLQHCIAENELFMARSTQNHLPLRSKQDLLTDQVAQQQVVIGAPSHCAPFYSVCSLSLHSFLMCNLSLRTLALCSLSLLLCALTALPLIVPSRHSALLTVGSSQDVQSKSSRICARNCQKPTLYAIGSLLSTNRSFRIS